ncbi:MAG: ABC transporter permease [Planctomycetes bacterium]|nr:ABC transporter permease [Planctomycetota bacterium]
MKKVLGIFAFLCLLYLLILIATDPEAWGSNNFNLSKRIGVYGISCLGVGLLIVTGGVDLSIGSVICFCAATFCWLVLDCKLPIPLAIFAILLLGAGIGALNGVLVTYVGLQAFVVTLCGLFAYRGAARWMTNDDIPRIAPAVASWSAFCNDSFLGVSVFAWMLLGFFAMATVFLHFTIHGRYFFAIGNNERAAHYSGINVNFYKILAYVLCSLFAAIGALMEVFWISSVQASSTGNFMELYAIAGAVLGGCSLRGGDGTTTGMIIGTAILCLLRNLIQMAEIKDYLEPVVIGGALLLCAILDEMLRRGISWSDISLFLRQLFRKQTP